MSRRRIALIVNGRAMTVAADPASRLSDVLREELQLIGTKVGCDAGDCGACTVLLDGAQICACMLPAAQAEGRSVETVEGLAADPAMRQLQESFHRHNAAQCGMCTPGMLMAAADLLRRTPHPDERQVRDALGGVLCRCTGYRAIVRAVLESGNSAQTDLPAVGKAVGAAMPKVDGMAKVTGSEIYAADDAPDDALWLRALRSPHPRARFAIGALDGLYARFPGLARVLTAQDVPGRNGFGIYPDIKDQPVLADSITRFRGEAVAALVGDAETVRGILDSDVPVEWEILDAVVGIDGGLADGAPLVQDDRPGNILTRGRLYKGDPEAAIAAAAHTAEATMETGFVEHAYIEPEAGWARRVGDRLEMFVTTQSPYMDRDETAAVLGIEPGRVRIIPSACGGAFGSKLDQSVQPLIGLAAWLLDRPVRCTYTRPESMMSTTKRHPARMAAKAACDDAGRLTAFDFGGDFDTGAYASWGPTVADRVPIHATGPYRIPNVRAVTRAVLTNMAPSGAFRGFGVPQCALVHEALMDALAAECAIDPLEFRLINAIRPGDAISTGHVLEASAGQAQCLEALRERWTEWREAADAFNRGKESVHRRGVGIGSVWYGCGNTSISNPSTLHVGIAGDGTVTLYSGAVDIGEGANTVMVQIAADALGIPAARLHYVMGDTDLTADAGKTSGSRQTYVSGKAAQRAGEDLRAQLLRMTNASEAAAIELGAGRVTVRDGDAAHDIDLRALPQNKRGDVLTGEGNFDPPTTPLDENGQGKPYGTYGFGAQIALVEVDMELGRVAVLGIAAAHDVGRAINPAQLEGQIHGGVAQGLGYALMEEYVPGRTENLHDYLIPTIGDLPPIEVVLIEDAEPTGPFGAKGIGEHSLIPTAPAILGGIEHATGMRLDKLPATPGRVRAALNLSGDV
ncbi:MAG: molybdopterin-dependent oxidoreductase [Alphaproteobacteria bacterium]|nr:molybdopterin-dependent oxidoreductase [Alphaproteobacteria bacterium]